MVDFGVVQVKIYDTDTEYELAREVRIIKKQFNKCKNAFLVVSVALIISVIYIALN